MTKTNPGHAPEHEDRMVAPVRSGRGVCRSGLYAWRDREPSARARVGESLGAHGGDYESSRGTCGAPRIHAELQEDGIA